MGVQDAIAEISTFLGQRLTRSKSDLDLHGRSESYFPLTPPDAVAYPETTQEVAQILRVCAKAGCPVIGWGTGTSLEGQAQAFQGGISVDFSRMNRVLEIRQQDMDVTVQPGVTRQSLNEELRGDGAVLSGRSGRECLAWGDGVDAGQRHHGGALWHDARGMFWASRVVTAAGEIIRTGTRARKSSSGYDLTSLFVGAEGTLGLITELTLRLHGQPEAISSAVCGFDTMGGAVQAVIDTIQMGGAHGPDRIDGRGQCRGGECLFRHDPARAAAPVAGVPRLGRRGWRNRPKPSA